MSIAEQRTVQAGPPVNDVERSLTTSTAVWKRIVGSPQFPVVVVMIVFVAFGASRSDAFLHADTWINILRNAVFICIIASCTTFVFVSGGLDLSVGSLYTVGAMSTSALLVHGWPVVLAIVGGCVVGAAAGLVNGILINYGKIPPFIMTLGMLYAAQSLVVYFTNGDPIAPLPHGFDAIAQDEVGGIPLIVIYALVIAIIAHVVLDHTTFGMSVRALGGNREAASNAGIRVRKLSTIVYVLSGLSAAVAGVLIAGRLGSGQPSVGDGFELQVISAVIIGGTSLFGGIGSVAGSVLGSLVLSILTTGLIIARINPTLQDFLVGVIIVAAVGLDQLRRRRMFRSQGQR